MGPHAPSRRQRDVRDVRALRRVDELLEGSGAQEHEEGGGVGVAARGGGRGGHGHAGRRGDEDGADAVSTLVPVRSPCCWGSMKRRRFVERHLF